MRKANENSSNDLIEVTIAILGRSTNTVEVPKGSTVGDVFEEADIVLQSGEFAMVDGENAENNDVPQDGDVITISSHKKGGNA